MKPIDQFNFPRRLRTPSFRGLAAIPSDVEGEPVFQEPWQLQIFSAVITLAERGILNLEDFEQQLNDDMEPVVSQVEHPQAYITTHYYRFWLLALEKLLLDRQRLQTQKMTGQLTTMHTP